MARSAGGAYALTQLAQSGEPGGADANVPHGSIDVAAEWRSLRQTGQRLNSRYSRYRPLATTIDAPPITAASGTCPKINQPNSVM